MSIYAEIDEAGPQYLVASNQGWNEFGDWADTLDHERFTAVVQLWEHAATDDFAGLIAQVPAALEDSPPRADVAQIARDLLAAAKAHVGAKVLLMTSSVGVEAYQEAA